MAAPILWKEPPDVRQDYDDNCWAAILEAFCAVAPGRPKIGQAQITKEFGNLSFSKTDGTMTRKGLYVMFADVRFGLKATDVAPAAFSELLLREKLGMGHVILGYYESKIGGYHVNLVYGINGTSVSHLDPDYSHGGLLKSPLAHFNPKDKDNPVIAWRAW